MLVMGQLTRRHKSVEGWAGQDSIFFYGFDQKNG